jgi:hypothetical protein
MNCRILALTTAMSVSAALPIPVQLFAQETGGKPLSSRRVHENRCTRGHVGVASGDQSPKATS